MGGNLYRGFESRPLRFSTRRDGIHPTHAGTDPTQVQEPARTLVRDAAGEILSLVRAGALTPGGSEVAPRRAGSPALRRFFEVDRHHVTLTALGKPADQGAIEPARVQEAIER